MKTKILLLFPILFLAGCAFHENKKTDQEIFFTAMGKANASYSAGDYKSAIRELNELIGKEDSLKSFKRERSTIFYNQACNYSLAGNVNASVNCLEKAVQYGYADFHHIEKDSDLDAIRGDKRYIRLAQTLQKEQALWDNKFMNTPYADNITTEEKIAGLSKLWSEIKFNFVNFDIIPGLNPDSLYMAFLPEVMATSSTLDYYWCLKAFAAHFHDGHTSVQFPKELQNRIQGRIPLRAGLVGSKIIVKDVYDESLSNDGLSPGDEITRINNLPATEYANLYIRPYWTANSPHGLDRTIFEYALFRGPVGEFVALTVENPDGQTRTFNIERKLRIAGRKWEYINYRKLDQNMGYVAINSFGTHQVLQEFDSVFRYIRDSDALIIDLRNNGGGNGSIGWAILGYFTDEPFCIFRWKTRMYRPVWRAWGRREEVFEQEPDLKYLYRDKPYSGPVVLLTRPRTGSMAENFCLGFRIMNRGKIIGGPTAGSSGTPLVFSLPGGGSARVVTTRGMFPDGKEFIGCGIEPDILVTPTIADFRKGYDRVLETAVRYLEGENNGLPKN